jgi:hypothetical protein
MKSKPRSLKDKFTGVKELWKIFTELLYTNVSDEGENISMAVCPLFF